ncbi:hypothetical protein Zm00014a_021362 [Zea mays]|uniref:Uncharacterized protein n=1 Tax=Zea mays TaxID=4577 RepID=A0A3L6ERQ4_MAIZE|nr:hypothetical protein Zm00014a_021362 [Zea mays]
MSGTWVRNKLRQASPPPQMRRGCFEPQPGDSMSQTTLTNTPGLPFSIHTL